MNEPEKQIHVSMASESWDVETESQTLAHAETKEDAIQIAKDLAPGEGATSITVHSSEGGLLEKISVPRASVGEA